MPEDDSGAGNQDQGQGQPQPGKIPIIPLDPKKISKRNDQEPTEKRKSGR